MADPRFYEVAPPITLKELSTLLGCVLHKNADPEGLFSGVAALDQAGAEDITFLANKKYVSQLVSSKAGACILTEEDAGKAPASMSLIISANPYYTYALVARRFYPHRVVQENETYIAPGAYIAPTAEIGKGCRIEHGVVIEDNVKIGINGVIGANSVIEHGVEIGDHCRIASNVTIAYALIGHNVRLHAGVRIGQSGFGFATHKGVHTRVPQLGRVIIGNDVDIGSNTTIDRGAGPDTVIGDGCQVDNLVQIGHNAKLGRGCVVVAQVGIAGSSKLGDYVVLGGQSGVAGHLTVGAGTQVAAQSGVIRDLPAGMRAGGMPAIPIRQWHKQSIILKKLAEDKGDK